MADAIICHNVSFAYERARPVIRNLNLVVREGEIVALVGPNGAGKTTLVRLLCGLVRPDEGRVRVFGADPFRDLQIRHSLGIMHQTPGFEQLLSGWDNLLIYGRFFGLSARRVRERVEEICETLGPMPYLDQPVMTLSGGQRRRLQIMRALLHHPKLLFLDEPTTGLDVEGRQQFYALLHQIITQLRATILWTSHHLQELERNCQRAVILVKGEVIFDAPMSRVAEFTRIQEISIRLGDDRPHNLSDLQDLGVEAVGSQELRYLGTPEEFYRHVLPEMIRRGVSLAEIRYDLGDLEQLYLEITRKAGKSTGP